MPDFVYLCRKFDSVMTNEIRDILLQLLDRHRELGISSQIDYDKFYMESIISNSVALSDPFPDNIVFDETEKMVDKTTLKQEMVDKTLFGRETGRYHGLCGR